MHQAAPRRRRGRRAAGRRPAAPRSPRACSRRPRRPREGRPRRPSRWSSRRPTSRTSTRKPLSRWLPVSGTLQPRPPGDRQGQGVGRRAPDHRARGRHGAGRPDARAVDTADLEARLIERQGALESREGAARARRQDAGDQPEAAQAELHLADRVRQLRIEHERVAGSVMSAEAQVQLAQNALRDAVAMSPLAGIVAKRHVQIGREGRVRHPARDGRRPDGDRAAGHGAADRRSRSSRSARRSSSRSTASASAASRDASSASIRPPSRGRAPSSCMWEFRTPTARCAAACSPPAGSRWPPAPRARRCPQRPSAPRPDRAFVWTVDGGKLVKRGVVTGRKDEATRTRRGQDRAAAGRCRCSRRGSTT